MSRTHRLKTWPGPFQAIWDGVKKHEVRIDDRGYCVGDELHLLEYEPGDRAYTNREIRALVTHITPGGSWGLPPMLCVMSIEVQKKEELNR